MSNSNEELAVQSKGKRRSQPDQSSTNNLDDSISNPSASTACDKSIHASTVRRRDKILAACAGGCLTSLTMTPLDVVKTRLQTQGQTPTGNFTYHQLKLVPMDFGCSSSSYDSRRKLCCHQIYRTSAGQAGRTGRSLFSEIRPKALNPSNCSSSSMSLPYHGSSSISGQLSSYDHPHLTQLKTCYESRSIHSTGILSTLIQIVNQEGLRSLWRGLAPALLISVPSQAIYMLGYDALRSTLLDLVPEQTRSTNSGSNSITFYRSSLVPLMSGVISRSFIAILFSPLELIRTRLQSTPMVDLRSLRTFDSNRRIETRLTARRILRRILVTVKSSGPSSLYAGLPATLWRDVPFSGIYWSSYEFTKRLLSNGKGFGEIEEGSNVRLLTTQSFLAGSLSGALAATLTNGFDVVKTRRQAQLISNTKDLSTLNLILQILRQQGFRQGLMSGLGPRLAKIVPSCGITIASYEGLAHFFSKF